MVWHFTAQDHRGHFEASLLQSECCVAAVVDALSYSLSDLRFHRVEYMAADALRQHIEHQLRRQKNVGLYFSGRAEQHRLLSKQRQNAYLAHRPDVESNRHETAERRVGLWLYGKDQNCTVSLQIPVTVCSGVCKNPR